MRADIPLKSAMIAWNPAGLPADQYPGLVIVVPWPDQSDRTKSFCCTIGACLTDWQETSPINRMRMLFVEVWHIVCRDGIDLALMHRALMVIPEYRDMLSQEKFFTWQRPRADYTAAADKIDYCLKKLRQLPLAHDIAPELTTEEVYGALIEASSIIKQHTQKY